jgi:hypothetical protein
MLVAICTLFEGDYHYGLGVLANSLYNEGFRGVIWAGYVELYQIGLNLLKMVKVIKSFLSHPIDCVIRFIELTTPKFLSNYKPDFMLQLWESYCPEVEALFYFGPDIVNKSC